MSVNSLEINAPPLETRPPGRMLLKPLSEQVIVITGASSGIGLATARAAVRQGATVVVASRHQEAIEQLEQELSSQGQVLGMTCDVSQEEEVRRLARTTLERFGSFDTWVNNAGVSIYGRLEDVEREDMRQLFETNFWGVVHGSLVALEYLKHQGGAIINIGSALSERSIPLQGIYSASKFAVRGFTDALRMEAEKSGYPVSITLIKPAAIDTPYTRHAKNYLPEEPVNPPPVYAPETVADTILHCATTPERDMFVGGAGMMFGLMEKVMPRSTDKVMEATLFELQQKDEPATPRGDGSLYRPSAPALQERGGYEGKVFETSPYTILKMHPGIAVAAALGVGLAAAFLLGGKSGASSGEKYSEVDFPR